MELPDDFDVAFSEQDTAQQEAEQCEQAQARLSALGTALMAEFSDAERARVLFELRWLDDLIQYRGQYPETVRGSLVKSGLSQVFYRMTTTKVDTMVARLMDLLFPARSKNWSIASTPAPMLPEAVVMEAVAPELEEKATAVMQETMQGLQAQHVVPDALAIQKLQAQAQQQALSTINLDAVRRKIATERAEAMELVIDDQLKEASAGGSNGGMNRPSWQQNCKAVIHSACLYGMGVLKGPLVEKRAATPVVGEDGTAVWQEQATETTLTPYHEAVSLWNVYPDPGAITPGELRFVWQMHLKTDKELWDLSTFPGFDGAVIARYLKDRPDGDASMSQWEAQLRTLNESNSGASYLNRRYRVYERWGYLTGQELRDAGNEVAEGDLPRVFSSNVWLLGDNVIKAMINPLEGVDIPYYFYPYKADETAFWPEGIACAIRAPQAGINAAVRATQDNAGLSSGPIIGINMQALAPGEDPTEVQARRLFLFDRAGNINEMFSAVTVPSCIEHNLMLIKFWQEAADEMSTPRFNSGDGRVSGAGETASGLSMLMGASNILLKDHVKDFDDTVTGPFIRAMYRWNMMWNPREDIKGDYEVSATGSQSLIAKEVRAQQIPGVMAMLQNPEFSMYIKQGELVKVALEQTDLPAERLLRTDDEAREYQQQQMVMQASAQAQAASQALVEELQKQGASPEQIQQNLLMLLAQQQTGQTGQAGQVQ